MEWNVQAALTLQARRAHALLELPQDAEQMDEAAFMQRGQELAEELTGSEIAFIHFVNDDEETIELVAWSRRTLEHYCRASYDKHSPVGEAGIWADALRRRRPVVFNDYASAPGRHGLPEGHAELTRIVTVPVIENGKVVMLAGVGNKQEPYTDLDVESVQLIANEIWRIVQRRRAAIALDALRRELEQTMNTMEEGIHRMDLQGNIVFENRAAARMLGWAPDELIGKPSHSTMHHKRADGTPYPHEECLVHATLQDGISRHVTDEVFWRLDGTSFPVDYMTAPMRNERGEIIGVVINFRDISELKRARERSLRDAEEFQGVLATTTDGFWIVGEDARLLEVNNAYCALSGYSREELLAMSVSQLEAIESPRDVADRMATIVKRGAGHFETQHRRKDGVVIDVDVSVTYMPSSRRMFCFISDITGRKRAEEGLKRSQRELRGLTKAANEALEAERRRTARELHDELGQLLTALKMDLQSLHAALPADQPALVQRAQTMHALLDSTIAATRRIASDLRPLMLDDLGLAAALDWLANSFSQRTGVVTDLIIDEAVAHVPEPIASALYRITQESLTNVTKYAQATTTEIYLERDGGWVQLVVRDNGRGIDQADRGKRGAFGLLGIRERVMLLGGEVEITGQSGRGSEVRVRVPLTAAEG